MCKKYSIPARSAPAWLEHMKRGSLTAVPVSLSKKYTKQQPNKKVHPERTCAALDAPFGLASAARRERAKPFCQKTFVFSIDSNRDCLQQSLFEISTLFLFLFYNDHSRNHNDDNGRSDNRNNQTGISGIFTGGRFRSRRRGARIWLRFRL